MAAIPNNSPPPIYLKKCPEKSRADGQAAPDHWWGREPGGSPLSLIRELGLAVLLRQFLLPDELTILRKFHCSGRWRITLRDHKTEHPVYNHSNLGCRRRRMCSPSKVKREAHFSFDLLSRFLTPLQNEQANLHPVPSLNWCFWQGDREGLRILICWMEHPSETLAGLRVFIESSWFIECIKRLPKKRCRILRTIFYIVFNLAWNQAIVRFIR